MKIDCAGRSLALDRVAIMGVLNVTPDSFSDGGQIQNVSDAIRHAQKMVQRWGMSDQLGPRVYGDNESEVFLGRDVTTHRNLSDATAEQVDAEISRIINEEYGRARQIIDQNRDKVEIMAKALLDWETLESDQIAQIMEGQIPRPPAPPDDTAPSGGQSVPPASDDTVKIKPKMDSPASDSA